MIVIGNDKKTDSYRYSTRQLHPENTLIRVGPTVIGEGSLTLIAGPCSIESQDQIIAVAKAVQAAGATILRGGAFKPRTSPYSFQGLGKEGIAMLVQAKIETGLPIISEITNPYQLDLFEDVDIIQVGARNMQNFELLRELGRINKPVLLKRGLASTIEELLMSAEYILSGGNKEVILCERGIRTFEGYTRNTMDISAVPILKQLTHLPVIADPSHASGLACLVPPLSLAAIAAGADGVMVEVHNDPKNALCDGPQSITPDEFQVLAREALIIHKTLSSFRSL